MVALEITAFERNLIGQSTLMESAMDFDGGFVLGNEEMDTIYKTNLILPVPV